MKQMIEIDVPEGYEIGEIQTQNFLSILLKRGNNE